jgi:outer membrane protein assembly factor BamB
MGVIGTEGGPAVKAGHTLPFACDSRANSYASRMRIFLAVFSILGFTLHAENWPMWRGGSGLGISHEKNLPTRWNATENIAWKIPLPARGNSTPIIWGEKIFVTQPLEEKQGRALLCFDRLDGKELWRRTVKYAEPEESHRSNPHCSESPATDGERVIAMHGSAGVFCYDFNGKELWKRDLGKISFEWGSAASPVIHGNLVYLYRGPDPKAHLLALDKRTGKTVWKLNDPAVSITGRTDGFRGNKSREWICSFSTPILVKTANREALVMSYPGGLAGIHPRTGKFLWNCGGLNPLIYSSPIAGEGVVVGMGGFFGTTVAVPAGGKGDMSAQTLWRAVRTPNRLGSGVVHDGHIYVLNTNGIMECLELKTGEVKFSERVRGRGAKQESWSSMLLAGDKIFIPNQSGETIVILAQSKFKLIGINPLDGTLTNSSLAASEGQFFLRTHKHLWCIGKRK